MPGMAASTSETWELASPPKAVEAPENNLACEVTWACASMPMTTSQSPVIPLISFDFLAGTSIASEHRSAVVAKPVPRSRNARQAPPRRRRSGSKPLSETRSGSAAALRRAEARIARQHRRERAVHAKLLAAPLRLRIAVERAY